MNKKIAVCFYITPEEKEFLHAVLNAKRTNDSLAALGLTYTSPQTPQQNPPEVKKTRLFGNSEQSVQLALLQEFSLELNMYSWLGDQIKDMFKKNPEISLEEARETIRGWIN